MTDDLALTTARFGTALRAAGVPADPGRCERFARAVTVARPATGRALYLCALATLVSAEDQIQTLQRVFAAVFGGAGAVPGDEHALALPEAPTQARSSPEDVLAQAARAARMHATQEPPAPSAQQVPAPEPAAGQRRATSLAASEGEDQKPGPEEDMLAARPVLASAAERLAGTDFSELSPAELLMLSGLMRKLTLAVPLRRSRPPRPTPHGGRTDLRATLRQARGTGGHPLRLARRAPLMEPRRLVVLCDISGSMEPYARAMLQLLYCAAGGAQAEVFTFATRLTRLTGTLAALQLFPGQLQKYYQQHATAFDVVNGIANITRFYDGSLQTNKNNSAYVSCLQCFDLKVPFAAANETTSMTVSSNEKAGNVTSNLVFYGTTKGGVYVEGVGLTNIAGYAMGFNISYVFQGGHWLISTESLSYINELQCLTISLSPEGSVLTCSGYS